MPEGQWVFRLFLFYHCNPIQNIPGLQRMQVCLELRTFNFDIRLWIHPFIDNTSFWAGFRMHQPCIIIQTSRNILPVFRNSMLSISHNGFNSYSRPHTGYEIFPLTVPGTRLILVADAIRILPTFEFIVDSQQFPVQHIRQILFHITNTGYYVNLVILLQA